MTTETDDYVDPDVHHVQLWICDLCLNGQGGECHVPGCDMWLNRAPDLPLRGKARLVPDDAEVRIEYGVRFASGGHAGLGLASGIARHMVETNYDAEAVVQRTVTTIRTGWQEVADDAE